MKNLSSFSKFLKLHWEVLCSFRTHYSGEKDLESLFELFATDRALLVQIIFDFVVSVALVAEN